MKKLMFAFIAIATLVLVSMANGADKQEIWYKGIFCSQERTSVACMPMDKTGYSVSMNANLFYVEHNGKIVMFRKNR
jgi:hypothetical protein